MDNFQFRVILLILIMEDQGLTVLAVDAGGVVRIFFSLVYHFCFPAFLSGIGG